MALTTIEKFATELKMPPGILLEQLSADRGMPISLFSGPSCGYIALRQPMANETPECLAFSRAVTDHVLAVCGTPKYKPIKGKQLCPR